MQPFGPAKNDASSIMAVKVEELTDIFDIEALLPISEQVKEFEPKNNEKHKSENIGKT